MEINYKKIKVIGFDADDTLWVNETYFREAEEEFSRLLSAYETPNKIDQELFKTIKTAVQENVIVKEIDQNINDKEFAEHAVNTLLDML